MIWFAGHREQVAGLRFQMVGKQTFIMQKK